MKYLATILAFIATAFGLSWCAVYSYWLAAFLFQSVLAVRICNAIGSVILIPVRLLFWLSAEPTSVSVALTDPVLYASINAFLLGTFAYFALRRRIFKDG